MYDIDRVLEIYFDGLRSDGLTTFMRAVTRVFDVWPFIVVAVSTALLLYVLRGWRRSALFFVSTLGTVACVYALKYFFSISRPLNGLVDVSTPSFPSGHTAVATAFFIMLMYVFDTHFSRVPRILFNAVCMGSIFLVAASRVYLGVHWISDVIAGVVVGGVVSYVCVSFFGNFNEERSSGTM